MATNEYSNTSSSFESILEERLVSISFSERSTCTKALYWSSWTTVEEKDMGGSVVEEEEVVEVEVEVTEVVVAIDGVVVVVVDTAGAIGSKVGL